MGVDHGSDCRVPLVSLPMQGRLGGRTFSRLERPSLAIDDQDLRFRERSLGGSRFGDREVVLVQTHREVAAGGRRPAAAIGELARTHDLGSALDEAAISHRFRWILRESPDLSNITARSGAPPAHTLIAPLRKSLLAIFTFTHAGLPAAKAASSAGPSSSTRLDPVAVAAERLDDLVVARVVERRSPRRAPRRRSRPGRGGSASRPASLPITRDDRDLLADHRLELEPVEAEGAVAVDDHDVARRGARACAAIA